MSVHACFSTPGSALFGISQVAKKGKEGMYPLELSGLGSEIPSGLFFLELQVSHCTHFSYFSLKNRRKHQESGMEMRKRGMVKIPLSVGCGFMSLIKCFSDFPSEK